MIVRRIVPNSAVTDLAAAKAFYRALLDLDIVMDLGWIATLASPVAANPQLGLAVEGGSSTPVRRWGETSYPRRRAT